MKKSSGSSKSTRKGRFGRRNDNWQLPLLLPVLYKSHITKGSFVSSFKLHPEANIHKILWGWTDSVKTEWISKVSIVSLCVCSHLAWPTICVLEVSWNHIKRLDIYSILKLRFCCRHFRLAMPKPALEPSFSMAAILSFHFYLI